MIYFIVARYDGDEDIYSEYIEKSLDGVGFNSIEVGDGEEKYTLTNKYNKGIEKILNNEDFTVEENDIVVFCHSDVLILDKYFSQKVEMVFQLEGVGLMGVIGAKEFTKNGMWWGNTPDKLFGHIVQRNGEKEYHLKKGDIGFCKDMVCVDGLLMAVRANLLMGGLRFDERFGFNFYDIDMCFQVKEMGKSVCVADTVVKHGSVGLGSLSDEWKREKELLMDKWKESNYIKD